MLDHGDDVWGVAAACTFGVICVNGATLDGVDGGLDETRFVERVGVNETLNVELVANR